MRISSAAAALLALVIPLAAHASMLTLLDTVDDPHSTAVDLTTNPTGSFTVNLRLDAGANDAVNGLTFVLKSLDANNIFSLSGRLITNFPMTTGTLSDPTTSDTDLLANPANLLAPSNTRDLGLTGPVGAKVTGSGTIMQVTISYNNNITPRDYRFNIGPDAVTNDNAFADHPLPAGQDYILHAAPEPAALLMVGALGLMIMPRMRPR